MRRRSFDEVLHDGLYDGLIGLVAVLLAPVALLRWLSRSDVRARSGERFARYSPELRARLEASEGTVWVHAVSVGEVRAVLPLVRALALGEGAGPPRSVVFTTVTLTGNATARAGSPEGTVVLYLPLDLRWVVRRAVSIIRPALFVSTESEIWPALLGELQRRGVPSAMANGRVSERTASRYRWVGFFMRRVLQRFQLFCMQSRTFAERIEEMGAPSDRIRVLGNLKYDLAVEEITDRQDVLAELGFDGERPLVVAGSTHEGEEAALLDAFFELDAERTGFDLLLAPRHPERFAAVAQLLEDRGAPHRRHSDGPGPSGGPAVRVLLLDVMGQLTRLYGVGDVAFVGGTLVPIGGHNLLEPAAVGLPVLFGPHTESCREIADGLEAAGGGIRMKNSAELIPVLARLLGATDERVAVGEAARSFLARHRGATERTVAALRELLT